MDICVHYHFSFPDKTIVTDTTVIIKPIRKVSGMNQINEIYTQRLLYTHENNFKIDIETFLNNWVRKSPGLSKCKIDFVNPLLTTNFLREEYNRKITEKHVPILSQEITRVVRSRFLNPDFFS